jgi:hypothetical protein
MIVKTIKLIVSYFIGYAVGFIGLMMILAIVGGMAV